MDWSAGHRVGWSLSVAGGPEQGCRAGHCYMTERDLFLIYCTHKIMIATSAHESIHRMLSVLRLSSKWRKGVSAHSVIHQMSSDSPT